MKQLFKLRNIIDEDEKIIFEAFKKWIGPSLERKEHFYFRHDSQDNPTFIKQVFEEGVKSPRKTLATHPLAHLTPKPNLQTSQRTDIFQDLVAKLTTKFVTLSQAFQEMNTNKDVQGIAIGSFARVLLNFGYFVDQPTLQLLFAKFDRNVSGYIEKEEFYETLGEHMMPGIEKFQEAEKPRFSRQKCRGLECLKSVRHDQIFCELHQANALENALLYCAALRNKVGDEHWGGLLYQMQDSIISYTNLLKIIENYDANS